MSGSAQETFGPSKMAPKISKKARGGGTKIPVAPVANVATVAGAKKFRLNRRRVGCTWSCPTDKEENPIPSMDVILEFATLKFGECDYTIGEELHESGTRHYHGWFDFATPVNSEDPHCFDVCGVHPNIIEPKKGWEGYCAKHGSYLTNHYEMCPYKLAAAAASVSEAMEILWDKKPQDCVKYGEAMERNLRRRIAPVPQPILYDGPFPASFWPPHWSPYTHSLLLWGEPGGCKTQFARYLMAHKFGEYEYIKKGHEMIKTHLTRTRPFIFDEVYLHHKDPEMSKEITDVEAGGSIDCRNSDVWIPPGLPRIFISNYEFPFLNPNGAVYGRRVVTHFVG